MWNDGRPRTGKIVHLLSRVYRRRTRRHARLPGRRGLTADPLETFGGFVVRVPDFQGSLRHSRASGYEHHVAVDRAQVAEALNEASPRYVYWDVSHRRA